MQAVLDAIERIPVATITHALVALVLGVDLIVQGSLSSDALTYAGIVEGGNIGVGASRAHVAGKKVDAAASAQPEVVNQTITIPARPPSPVVADAPDEPGDDDALPHVSTTTEAIPADQGDSGEATA